MYVVPSDPQTGLTEPVQSALFGQSHMGVPSGKLRQTEYLGQLTRLQPPPDTQNVKNVKAMTIEASLCNPKRNHRSRPGLLPL